MIQIANAKLTTYLHVTGVRDDGYHFIEAEMVSLDLADMLEFSDGDGLEVVGSPYVPADGSNLIARALALAGRKAHVRVTKRIPVGGGLGGGSSNAAAALRWAERPDPALGAQLGADVPFCLQGGRARVSGIGEILEVAEFETRTFTLLVPPFGVSTPAVFRKYDELAPGFDAHERNDLTTAALAVEPRMSEWRDKFAKWTGAEPVLAGSGSTWFVDGEFNKPKDVGHARWIVAHTVPAVS